MNGMGRRGLGVVAAALVGMAAPVGGEAAQLRPEMIAAWDAYVRATEHRIDRELASDRGFLASDFVEPHEPARPVPPDRIPVARVEVTDARGDEIPVPGGMVHHWRGRVFIPGVTVDQVLQRVANPQQRDTAQEDVLLSRVLERGPGSLRLFLRLQRSQIVTVVYDTEHAVTYQAHGAGRASSRSVATRIAEIAHPHTPREAEKPLGQDRGFLWRLNSYWRYQQVAGGTVVECESISLSRSVPAVVRMTVGPLIDLVARGSMERTLSSMRDRFDGAARQADGQ